MRYRDILLLFLVLIINKMLEFIKQKVVFSNFFFIVVIVLYVQ